MEIVFRANESLGVSAVLSASEVDSGRGRLRKAEATMVARIAPMSITEAVATAICARTCGGTPKIHVANTIDDTIAPDSPE